MKELTLDWKEYEETARQVVAEGCVLLENNGVLPLKKDTKVALFGRIQNHYYKSGTGSGGMVNVTRVVGIKEALAECEEVVLDSELLTLYEKWEEENPYDEGIGWGNEPWSQVEMELTEEVAKQAAQRNDVAVVIIGRTAGEDKDASNTPGSYRLTPLEEQMLEKVREAFDRMVVLFNIGGLMDFSLVDAYHPEAVMITWCGGMVGGYGVVDVLTGKVSPSGHLTDTVSYEIEDHYADRNFGGVEKAVYEEDIYVGYRYFETFAKDCVRYPFGYGLSYTTFKTEDHDFALDLEKGKIKVSAKVTNVGSHAGKNVTFFFMKAPQGLLGKPEKVLIGFAKTKCLAPGESQEVAMEESIRNFASFDDSGVTGKKNAFVLEEGAYGIYVGDNVRRAHLVGTFLIDSLYVVEQLEEAMAPVENFKRLHPVRSAEGYEESLEDTPVCTIDMDERRKAEIPEEITLDNARDEAEERVAKLTDDDLTCIIRGEGMGSSRVTPGTASAFCGVSNGLTEGAGLPAVCCSDGPSGMRLDCGTKAFSLPAGTLQGATFNTELIARLYAFTGLEMVANKVECLLGPGMNIHRHPLNGRNFEYFSEDPLVTGKMAGAVIQGLHRSGVTGVCKHFCGNNQETSRYYCDSVVSQRALREIYLRGFEIAVREYGADAMMTTYGRVNGLWTAGSYDLNTTILRMQWGFTGIVMTDWWANINERGGEGSRTNFGAMVRAQNDMYMVCPDGNTNASGDNIMEALTKGWVAKSELQRSAANIIRFTLQTEAMKRLQGEGTKVNVIGKPADETEVDLEGVEFIQLNGELTLPLDYKESKGNTSYVLPMEVSKVGTYEVTLVGSSELGELAQLPCTLIYCGFPIGSYTFHGTNGELDSISREIALMDRFNVMRLFVAKNGLKLKEIRFHFLHEGRP